MSDEGWVDAVVEDLTAEQKKVLADGGELSILMDSDSDTLRGYLLKDQHGKIRASKMRKEESVT